MERTVLTVLLTAALGYALLVGLMYVSQRALMYPGTGGPGLPDPPPWDEAVRIDTADGERLRALYSGVRPDGPAAIFFHGNADTIANYGFLAEALAERGIGLLAVSYRGYGGSTGAPTETGLLSDGVAAFDWLAARTDGPVALVGQSLGTGVAVDLAGKRDAAGLVLMAAYRSMRSLAQAHYPYMPVGPLIKDTFRSDLRIAGVAKPKLFIHGRDDTIVPLTSGTALYDAAPEPKDMRVFDGLGHNDLWTVETLREVVDFIARVTGRAEAAPPR